MKLYTYFRSSAAFRVRIALNLTRLPFESVTLQLREAAHHRPEYTAVNPQRLVPTLDDEGTIVVQSLAIIEYLEETHPDPALLPRAPADRALVRSMALAVACDIHPLNNLRVLNFLRGVGLSEAQVHEIWYPHWIAAGLQG